MNNEGGGRQAYEMAAARTDYVVYKNHKKHVLVHTRTAGRKYTDVDSKNYQRRECSNDKFQQKIGNFVYFAKERKGIFLTRRRGRPGLGLVTSWQLFGNFWDFRQLLKFLTTFNFLAFLKLFFTFFATFISFRKKSRINSIGVHYCVSV